MTQPDPIAWIAERAKCDMSALVQDFRKLVNQNVEGMNRECSRREWPPFVYIPLSRKPDAFRVKQDDEDTRTCTFTYQMDRQVVEVVMANPDRTYAVRTRWDGEAQQCRVVVERTDKDDTTEFSHDQLGKVVSYLLEPFFFQFSSLS